MPSFKPKAAKKIKVCKKYTTTLDGKHKEFVNQFTKDEFDIIPRLKEERYSLNKQLELEKDLTIEKIMEIKDRIKEINENIKELKYKKLIMSKKLTKLLHLKINYFIIFLKLNMMIKKKILLKIKIKI